MQKRLLILFIYAFSSISVPVLALFVLSAFLPSPYSINLRDKQLDKPEVLFGSNASNYSFELPEEYRSLGQDISFSVGALYPDNSSALLLVTKAQDLKDKLTELIDTNTETEWETTFDTANGEKGVVISLDQYLFVLKGESLENIRERMKNIPLLMYEPEKNFLYQWLTAPFYFIVLPILAYCFFQMFIIWPRIGSWAGTIKAGTGVSPVTKDILLNRLLMLKTLDLPFHIQKSNKDDTIIAEWKITDNKWIGLMHAGGIKYLVNIKLTLNEGKHYVQATDNLKNIEWSVDVGGQINIKLHYNFFSGIVFKQFDRARMTGVLFKDGTIKIDDAYNYKFNMEEIKQPIVKIITLSGWDYVPVAYLI